MNQIIKKKWISELNSSNYKQGKFALRQIINEETCHCPIGVLCELYMKEFKAYWELQGHSKTKYTLYGLEGTLPPSILIWSDLNEPNPYMNGIGTIIDLNDTENKTFKQIA